MTSQDVILLIFALTFASTKPGKIPRKLRKEENAENITIESKTDLCHHSISQAIYITSQSTSVIFPIEERDYVKNCTSHSKDRFSGQLNVSSQSNTGLCPPLRNFCHIHLRIS
ncbi:hypothetical protein CEXT_814721 [Caerostris extrusa]|uniref:Secreted protein n=1 Tax=Caerostris extrusa TaxID=172846 RepID=A0AAV4PFS4_CAEEX|nr:hypothetical protein CEXT_814721 [Caerostris extrusa]